MNFLLVLLSETVKCFVSNSEMEIRKPFPWDNCNKDTALQLVLLVQNTARDTQRD